jgi:hypothetical protein
VQSVVKLAEFVLESYDQTITTRRSRGKSKNAKKEKQKNLKGKEIVLTPLDTSA